MVASVGGPISEDGIAAELTANLKLGTDYIKARVSFPCFQVVSGFSTRLL